MQQKNQKSPRLQEALAVVLEEGSYVVQRRHKKTGEWQNASEVLHGRKAADDCLKYCKETDRYGYQWRAVQEVIAQAYAHGWASAESFHEGGYEPYDEEHGLAESA